MSGLERAQQIRAARQSKSTRKAKSFRYIRPEFPKKDEAAWAEFHDDLENTVMAINTWADFGFNLYIKLPESGDNAAVTLYPPKEIADWANTAVSVFRPEAHDALTRVAYFFFVTCGGDYDVVMQFLPRY